MTLERNAFEELMETNDSNVTDTTSGNAADEAQTESVKSDSRRKAMGKLVYASPAIGFLLFSGKSNAQPAPGSNICGPFPNFPGCP